MAATNGNVEILKIFIDHGKSEKLEVANIGATDSVGTTAIQLAAFGGHTDFVKDAVFCMRADFILHFSAYWFTKRVTF